MVEGRDPALPAQPTYELEIGSGGKKIRNSLRSSPSRSKSDVTDTLTQSEQEGTPSSALRGYPALMNMLRMSRAEARTSALDVCTKTCSHTQRCGGQASSQCPAVRVTRADARGGYPICQTCLVQGGALANFKIGMFRIHLKWL